MNIIIAPDSFKGSNTSIMVADSIERGVLEIFPDASIRKIPIADGGEGTVDAVVNAGGGKRKRVEVTGPLGEPVTASYGLLPEGRGVIEMAAASGLPLVPGNRRNPEKTTTTGTGELIRDALDEGCRELLIGIGGSATNDGGIGMATALGYEFLDANDRRIEPTGGALATIEHIDRSGADSRLASTKILIACDVQNPLIGPEGASAVYGPQKGADGEMIARLDEGLSNLAVKIRDDLGIDVAELPGAGAAGGLGAGLVAFCGGELKSGIDAVLDIVRFDDMIGEANLVITGEGAMDGSTAYGKVPVGIARRARKLHIPVLAVVGNIGRGAETVYEHGIDGIMSTVNGAMPLEEAIERSSELLREAAERLMRFVRVGMALGS